MEIMVPAITGASMSRNTVVLHLPARRQVVTGARAPLGLIEAVLARRIKVCLDDFSHIKAEDSHNHRLYNGPGALGALKGLWCFERLNVSHVFLHSPGR